MPSNTSSNKVNSNITGATGEFFVAGEISKRGAVATLTLKNTPKIDILATNLKKGAFANIQVKTRSKDNKQGWKLTNKVEEKSDIKNLFYVFVNLRENDELIDYYIIPHNEFADFIIDKHKRWMNIPDRNGNQHKDNTIRNFKPEKEHLPFYKADVDLGKKYKNKWEVLGIF